MYRVSLFFFRYTTFFNKSLFILHPKYILYITNYILYDADSSVNMIFYTPVYTFFL